MTKHDLKELAAIGAELGAAKAENEAMREALHWYAEKVAECRKIGSLGDNARQALDLDGGFRARDALPRQADHLRDATQMMVPSEIIRAIAWGDRDDAAEAIGNLRCLLADPDGEDEVAFPDSPEPTDAFTAVDMATAAAQGFRDGQAAVEPAPAQDEREAFEAHMRLGGYSNPEKHHDGSYVSSAMELWWQGWKARATRPAQTEQTALNSGCEWCAGAGKDHFGEKCEHCQAAPQPEQSGLAGRLNSVIAELKGGFVVCEECGGQEDTSSLDCVPELESIYAALSAQGQSDADS